MKKCIDCNERKALTEFHTPSHKRCRYCANIYSRLGHLSGFPNTFNYNDFEYLRLKFKITKDAIKLYDLDHFIPKSWGHGGSHRGNVYLLSRYFNKMKSAGNPFKEFDKIVKKHPSFQSTAEEIIKHIASVNGLTIGELEQYVNWCEANKRNKVTSDKTSIQLWKEALTLA